MPSNGGSRTVPGKTPRSGSDWVRPSTGPQHMLAIRWADGSGHTTGLTVSYTYCTTTPTLTLTLVASDTDSPSTGSTGPRRIYLIGSMRNPEVPRLANRLRAQGHEVHDDWYSPGPRADDHWQAYEKQRGRPFKEAVRGRHVEQVFEADKRWLSWADTVVLLLPAGKSGHLELGYAIGQGKRAYVVLDGEPERFDIMYRFADTLCDNIDELLECLRDE